MAAHHCGLGPSEPPQQGLTLIELVSAIFIFSIGILGIFSLVGASMDANHLAFEQSLAMNLAEAALDEARMLAFDEVLATVSDSFERTGLPAGVPFFVRQRVAIADATEQHADVTVEVRWDHDGKPATEERVVSLTGRIFRLGI